MISDPLLLTAVVAATTLLAFWLDWRIPAMGKGGASLLALARGAIAWLLLAVHIGDLKRAGPRMVAAFALAGLGTAMGAFVGAFIFADFLGENTWKLAGTLTGTYTGGSLNFVAVGTGLELPPGLFAGATAADAMTTGLWLGASLLLPIWLARFYPPIPAAATETDVLDPGAGGTGVAPGPESSGPPREAAGEDEVSKDAHHPFFMKEAISTLDLAVLMAVGLALLAVSDLTAAGLAALAESGRVPGWVGSIPSVLWLTTFALLIGHTRWLHRPPGALQLGTLALHFFFVVIGIWSRVSEILAVGVEVFFYTLVVVGVHGLVVYGGGRLARLDLGSLSVASQAAVGGPSSALAVAVSRKWPGFILPGIIVGLVGYAAGNYLGFGVAYLVRGLGIGL